VTHSLAADVSLQRTYAHQTTHAEPMPSVLLDTTIPDVSGQFALVYQDIPEIHYRIVCVENAKVMLNAQIVAPVLTTHASTHVLDSVVAMQFVRQDDTLPLVNVHKDI
jgi:hypothetical protein